MTLSPDSQAILQRLTALRASDAPTRGGRVFSYVYDAGNKELDELSLEAGNLAQTLNGLDPMTFPSIAVMEREILEFARSITSGTARGRGAELVLGSVTSGGTESSLLAALTARERWRAGSTSGRRPRLVAPVTAHLSFQKACKYFDLEWSPVACNTDGTVSASSVIEALDTDVALVVLSAPAYPSGAMDPIAEVAPYAKRLGISFHVDACYGGMVLPWWPDAPEWDFRVSGVTSLAADLHKFGYAPKGVSVLLQRGRDRRRTQFFASNRWPGYPIVNPTLLSSRSTMPTASAWAIIRKLGDAGYRELTQRIARSASRIITSVEQIDGLAIWGNPIGPSLALITDPSVPQGRGVDPHRLADALARDGFHLQYQPGLEQSNGVKLPHSAHLTVSPAIDQGIDEFLPALSRAADKVRGKQKASAAWTLAGIRALGYGSGDRVPSPEVAWRMLRIAGVGGNEHGNKPWVPQEMASLMTVLESLPSQVTEALLIELLARLTEPRAGR